MEIRLLHYFLAIAKEGNMTKAANTLHITQPTLSKQLAQLEDELDTKLFIRARHNMQLTQSGLLLRERATEIIELTHKTINDLKSNGQKLQGEVKIGSGETSAFSHIIKIIGAVKADYPLVSFDIFSGNGFDVTEKLDKGLLDFGLLIGSVNIDKYHTIQLQERDIWGLLMRKDALLSQLDAITVNDLKGLPVVVSKQASATSQLLDWLGKPLDAQNVVASYNLINNARLIVESGLAYGIVIDKVLDLNAESNIIFKPFEPVLESDIYIAWRKKTYLSPAAEAFLKEMRLQLG